MARTQKPAINELFPCSLAPGKSLTQRGLGPTARKLGFRTEQLLGYHNVPNW